LSLLLGSKIWRVPSLSFHLDDEKYIS
jgi:hypothetical protein